MKITPIDLKKIKIDDTNPNRMTDEKKEALKKSIEKFGELQPVIVDKHFNLIDGEHRYHAYKQLGKLQIPAIIVDIENKSDKKLLRQLMNKIRGTHDQEIDADEFKLIMEDYSMEEMSTLLGDSEQEIIKIISILEKEPKMMADSQEQQLYKHMVTCPFCGKKFERGIEYEINNIN